jgi:general secretion pathway protein G
MNKNRKGFTLIELLVVIGIIGLLSTLAVVALGSARQKARDSKRLSDMKQIQTALELYFTDNNAYPASDSDGFVLGIDATCLNGNGLESGSGCTGTSSIYMALIPKDPQYPTLTYIYTSSGTTNYLIAAELEGSVNDLGPGVINATPNGIQ